MEDTVITWSVTNWATILLMVVIGFAAVKLGSKLIDKAKGNA